jgi:hypothetical protein
VTSARRIINCLLICHVAVTCYGCVLNVEVCKYCNKPNDTDK